MATFTHTIADATTTATTWDPINQGAPAAGKLAITATTENVGAPNQHHIVTIDDGTNQYVLKASRSRIMELFRQIQDILSSQQSIAP